MRFYEGAIRGQEITGRRLQGVAPRPTLSIKHIPGYLEGEAGYVKNRERPRWELVEAGGDELHIRLLFDEPVWVSQGAYPDEVLVEFHPSDKPLFVGKGSALPIDYKTALRRRLPAQAAPGASAVALASATAAARAGMSAAVASTFACNLLLAYGLSHMWGMVNGL